MKKIIAFAVGTIALVGTAIGVQAFATTSHDQDRQPPAAGVTKQDDGQRSGFTEDHTDKPGESK